MCDDNNVFTKKFSVKPSKTESGWVITPISGGNEGSGETLNCIALAGTEAGTEAKVKFLLAEESQAEWKNLSMTSLNMDDPTEVELTLFKSVQDGNGFTMKFLNRKGTTLGEGIVIEDFRFSSINVDGNAYVSEDPKLGTIPPPNK